MNLRSMSRVLLGVSACLSAGETEVPRRPNLLFIMTDQQHARMLGCAGEAVSTPHLDRLASAGVRFTRAYCSNPVCIPSRISMMTGRYPSRYGIENNTDVESAKPGPSLPKSDAAQGLGNLVRAAGYATWFGGKTHWMDGMTPASLGFETYVRNEREKLAKAAASYILTVPQSKPFFMVVSFINPHDIAFFGIDAHAAANGTQTHKWAVTERRTLASVLMLKERMDPLAFLQLCPPLPGNFEPPASEATRAGPIDPDSSTAFVRNTFTEADWRTYRYAYRRLTEMVDGDIGVVLDALDKAGLAEETVVIFSSDHGDMDGAHRLDSKARFYEESSGVPFIMRYPGAIPAGAVDNEHLVGAGIDLLPTLCDYAGAQYPTDLPGRSLRSIAEGATPKPAWRQQLVVEATGGRMLVTGRYKYCTYAQLQAGAAEIRESFVDLHADPGEMMNLIHDAGQQARIRENREWLSGWIKAEGDSLGTMCLTNQSVP